MSRIFVYDGREFPDQDPSLSPDDVRRQLSDFFPELANADVRDEKRGDDTVYTFSRRIGTKGAAIVIDGIALPRQDAEQVLHDLEDAERAMGNNDAYGPSIRVLQQALGIQPLYRGER
jgi:PRTRC genetic system protein C